MNSEEQGRYSRQLKMEEWGPEAQQRLGRSRVCIAGLGGLGGPMAYYLTAAGAGRLLLWDRDEVELSNLNRQILYVTGDEGRKKSAAAAERLGRLNPEVELQTAEDEISRESLAARAGEFDLIADCLDNFETRFALNEQAVREGIPMVHAGVRGMQGQVTVIAPGQGPCLECLFSGMESERGTPVLGAAVGSLGCIAATEALKLLTGAGEPLIGRLLIYDGRRARFQEIEVSRNPACPVCGSR